jgi:hypothetical protein
LQTSLYCVFAVLLVLRIYFFALVLCAESLVVRDGESNMSVITSSSVPVSVLKVCRFC